MAQGIRNQGSLPLSSRISSHGGPVRAHRRLLPSPGPSRLPSWCLRLSVYSSAITHLPNSTSRPAFTPPLSPSTGITGVGWGSPAPPSPYLRVEGGADLGKEIKVPALRGTQPSTWGPVLLPQSPEPPGAVGVCGCPWEPTLAQAVMPAHRCPCLPVHARACVWCVCVCVWAAVATWAS